MALTRPKIWDIDTNITAFNDPITVLHQGATSANVDVGFLFNRANGLVSNVALYWSEGAQSFVTSFTSNTGSTNSNIAPSSYANLTIGSLLTVNGAAIKINGTTGAYGQTIISTGTGIAWGDPLAAVTNVGASGNVTAAGNVVVGTSLASISGSTTLSIGTSPVAIDTFSSTEYRSGKYVISVTDVTNTEYQTSEVVLVQNGTTASISSYGIVYSNASPRMTFTASISSGNVVLYGTGVSANNTVKLTRTLIPV